MSKFFKNLSLVHPYLFAIAPIVHLYAHNFGQCDAREFGRYVAAALAITAMLLALAWLATRAVTKATCIVTVFLIVFMNYGRLYDYLVSEKCFRCCRNTPGCGCSPAPAWRSLSPRRSTSRRTQRNLQPLCGFLTCTATIRRFAFAGADIRANRVRRYEFRQLARSLEGISQGSAAGRKHAGPTRRVLHHSRWLRAGRQLAAAVRLRQFGVPGLLAIARLLRGRSQLLELSVHVHLAVVVVAHAVPRRPAGPRRGPQHLPLLALFAQPVGRQNFSVERLSIHPLQDELFSDQPLRHRRHQHRQRPRLAARRILASAVAQHDAAAAGAQHGRAASASV